MFNLNKSNSTHLAPPEVGALTRCGGTEAEAHGTALGVPGLQVEGLRLALGAPDALHIVLTQALGRVLVTHL